eukprot:gnl/Hemi2/10602_TR3661_c1_g21_i1.p3 gnl/Hemi2/10602_TR3661_c1_g21~~gnl/Hemi2/10602_TR3661_c1_g21_i1.p3  ORF type:complete len:107 (-),score=16.20 gnl/Hemi2/10602_TR3661_c1_g21_i1:50-370(-)
MSSFVQKQLIEQQDPNALALRRVTELEKQMASALQRNAGNPSALRDVEDYYTDQINTALMERNWIRAGRPPICKTELPFGCDHDFASHQLQARKEGSLPWPSDASL